MMKLIGLSIVLISITLVYIAVRYVKAMKRLKADIIQLKKDILGYDNPCAQFTSLIDLYNRDLLGYYAQDIIEVLVLLEAKYLLIE